MLDVRTYLEYVLGGLGGDNHLHNLHHEGAAPMSWQPLPHPSLGDVCKVAQELLPLRKKTFGRLGQFYNVASP